LIHFHPETSDYTIRNGSPENTGTWVKIMPNSQKGKRVEPGMTVSIADVEFELSAGEEVRLEDVVFELIPLEIRDFYQNAREVLEVEPETVAKTEKELDLVKTTIGRLKTFPPSLRSLHFSSTGLSFSLHYKPISLGNQATSSVFLPSIQPFAHFLQYTSPFYTIEPDKSSPIYRKLANDEEFLLAPGQIFRVGRIEFLASRFNVGRWSHIGKRPAMEDADIVCHNLYLYDDLPVAFYAVYDGHGGSQCSQFLKSVLHETLRETMLKHPGRQTDVMNALRDSLFASFASVDQCFLADFPEICKTVGSAAIACLVIGDRIITANLGDSRAVLSRGGRAIDLSVDHKPGSQSELDRILACGGCVMLGRIDSKLAVSRAFGDFDFKIPAKRSNVVSAEPECSSIFINPAEDEFIVLGCDGLFEAYTSQELVDIVRSRLASMPETQQDPNRVIREVVNEAVFESRTSDNVTAILVTLTSAVSVNR
jgi:protein phosphatase PTC2/3